MSNKAKKLSFAEYNRLDRKLNERKKINLTVTLPNGETNTYQHTIACTFKESEIQKLCIDYLSLLSELQSQDDIKVETILNATSLLNALIIKYFSDIPVPESTNIQSVINVSDSLFNYGIMQQLFGDGECAFSKFEIDKISKVLDVHSETIGNKLGELAAKAALKQVGDGESGHNQLETT